MATLLEVTVSKLLGIDIDSRDIDDLTAELARVNEELANKNRQEITMKRASEKRGLILFLSFASMLICLIIKNALLSAVLSGICMLCGVLILYRNMALLTSITTENMRIKTLRITTIVNIGFLGLGIVMAVLTAADLITFTEHEERMFAMLLVACVMIFAGIISPKLPFTRHTGLRLPWTVRDEDTWNLAHKIVGYISLPVALLYMACSLTIEDFEMVTLLAMLIWIGVPGGISYIYFWRKMHGKL